MEVRTIKEQSGWDRPYPKAICQEFKVFIKLYEYSFNLKNADFVLYVRNRIGIDFSQRKNLKLSYACEKYILRTGGKVELKFYKIMKGKLQDCWELYLAERRAAK